MKHENGKECERCAFMLKDAHPGIHHWFYRIKARFPTAHCSYIFRGKDEQNRLVEERASKLKWPLSKHNHMEGDKKMSKAMDLFSLMDDGEASFRMTYYAQICMWLVSQNAEITWGGSWKTFPDSNHFELKD